MSIIKNHCLIELCIDEIIYRLRLQMFAQSHGANGLQSPDDPEPNARPLPRSASSSHFHETRRLAMTGLTSL